MAATARAPVARVPDPSRCWPRFADDLPRVRERAREIKREMKAQVYYEFCESCDAYHIIADPKRVLINEKNRRILELVAIGYRMSEIAQREDVGLTMSGVENRIHKMQRKLNAFSLPHLVLLAVYLGLIKPQDHLPGVKRLHG